MKETQKYLQEKIIEFTNERNEYARTYNDNHSIMVETKHQIDKIKNELDEAMEIFSPKSREANSFNKNEINNLELKIVTLSEINNGLSSKVEKLDKEINKIKKCSEELENYKKPRTRRKKSDVVSRETILSRLKYINELIYQDPHVAEQEIKKLILENEVDKK